MTFQENLTFQMVPPDIHSLAMQMLMNRWTDKRTNLATIIQAY